jgi:hypothetical protein
VEAAAKADDDLARHRADMARLEVESVPYVFSILNVSSILARRRADMARLELICVQSKLKKNDKVYMCWHMCMLWQVYMAYRLAGLVSVCLVEVEP